MTRCTVRYTWVLPVPREFGWLNTAPTKRSLRAKREVGNVPQQAIASSVAKPQSAPVKSWIDRTCSQPTAGGLCVLLLAIESATRRWGFASAQKPGGAQQNLLRTTKVKNPHLCQSLEPATGTAQRCSFTVRPYLTVTQI